MVWRILWGWYALIEGALRSNLLNWKWKGTTAGEALGTPWWLLLCFHRPPSFRITSYSSQSSSDRCIIRIHSKPDPTGCMQKISPLYPHRLFCSNLDAFLNHQKLYREESTRQRLLDVAPKLQSGSKESFFLRISQDLQWSRQHGLTYERCGWFVIVLFMLYHPERSF